MDTKHASGQAIDRQFTRRDYLVYQAVMNGADAVPAMDLVDGWANEHPEYDMDETMTWAEWQERPAAGVERLIAGDDDEDQR